MSRWLGSLLGTFTLLAVSQASVIWQDGPEPMPVPPFRTHILQIANDGPEPMPVPPFLTHVVQFANEGPEPMPVPPLHVR
jgi:hypothetical protein